MEKGRNGKGRSGKGGNGKGAKWQWGELRRGEMGKGRNGNNLGGNGKGELGRGEMGRHTTIAGHPLRVWCERLEKSPRVRQFLTPCYVGSSYHVTLRQSSPGQTVPNTVLCWEFLSCHLETILPGSDSS